jgi:sugar phosphate isomerase/epimerase
MAEITRREWNRLALSGLVAAALPINCRSENKRIDSRYNGVQIGVQSYSFRDRSLEDAIKAMVDVGLGSCELWSEHVEPKDLLNRYYKEKDPQSRNEAREALRRWRLNVPFDDFRTIRSKFDRAGIELYAYNLSFRDDFSDDEIERGFEMAKALGVKVMTSSSNVSTAKRIDRFAKRFKMRVGLHNHSDVGNPNEISTPESIAKAMQGTSDYIAINLDIGHFTAANFDASDFLRQHHDQIVTLHIKDRKRNQGPNVPFGNGDAPIKEVLALLRDNKWPIPANIEYEYDGQDTLAEVKRSLAYCKQALGA